MAKSKCKVERRNSCNREKVLIDGQQRITAMAAAIVGQEVLDSTINGNGSVLRLTPLTKYLK